MMVVGPPGSFWGLVAAAAVFAVTDHRLLGRLWLHLAYRVPDEQIEMEFSAARRDEARAILETVATYVPPDRRDAVKFRLLREARGSVRRLRDAAVRELAVLPDGTPIPRLLGK